MLMMLQRWGMAYPQSVLHLQMVLQTGAGEDCHQMIYWLKKELSSVLPIFANNIQVTKWMNSVHWIDG